MRRTNQNNKPVKPNLKAKPDPKRVAHFKMLELLTRPEPLREELNPYLVQTKLGRFTETMIKHPLCVSSLPGGPGHAAVVHGIIDDKLKLIETAKKKGDWETVLSQYETAFLLEGFVEHSHAFDDKQYWTLLAHVWAMQESLWPNRKLFLTLFTSSRLGREHLMRPEERKAFAKLTETITVYRGYSGARGKGQSWTTEKNTAEWFAKRWVNLGLSSVKIVTGQVRKTDVLAYFTRRKECEIVVDPNKVKQQRSEVVKT